MSRRAILTLLFFFASQSGVQAQLSWSEISTPASVNQFALGSDGSIYIVTGKPPVGYNLYDLYFSGDNGRQWTQIYSGVVKGVCCDSNGAVIIYDDRFLVSTDHGSSWDSTTNTFGDVFFSQGSYIASSRNATYFAWGPYSSLLRSTDNGKDWITLGQYFGGGNYDWEGLYAGPDDRVLATFNGSSDSAGSALYANGDSVYDTLASITCLSDKSPPTNVLFGHDGYIYEYQSCTLLRLPPNTLKWQRYGDSVFDWDVDSPSHMPLGSANALTILSLDSSVTYASNNRGDSWRIIGTGIPTSYPPGVSVSFTPDGEGYALADGGILYRTSFFQSSVAARTNDISPIIAYPIPCKSSLCINASGVGRVEVIDVLGISRIVRDFGEPQTNPMLDVSGLAAGVYSLAVYSGGVRSFVRVVKE